MLPVMLLNIDMIYPDVFSLSNSWLTAQVTPSKASPKMW